jgi:hypothetical protein
MSPTFAGKVFEIPAPTLCPDCRRRRRFAWRNLTKIYKRKCDFSGKEVISPYAPNSCHKVYESSIWWSDSWSPLQYGKDVDFSRPFLEQLQEIHLAVPKPHAVVVRNENSEFTHNVTEARDSYLIQGSSYVEKSFYGQGLLRVKDSVDCLKLYDSELCYECLSAEGCYGCFFSSNLINCRNSYFLDDCIGCSDCFACSNLNNKQYYIFNEAKTKEEFEKERDEFLNLSGEKRQKKIEEIRKYLVGKPKKFSHFADCENFTGDYLNHVSNAYTCFHMINGEDIKYCSNVYNNCKSCYDYDFWGNNVELALDCVELGNNSNNVYFSRRVFENCSNIFYSIEIQNGCHDCFGCTGLRQAEYCILNKQYTKQRYEDLAVRIIEKMQAEGEWGEFFPMSMSSFGYNETINMEHYPLSKEEALKLGATWQDEDFSMKYEGPFYEPKEIKTYDPECNPEAEKEVGDALRSVIKCEVTGEPFKIQPNELRFYIKNRLQIPRRHPDQRYEDRVKLRNPMHLWHRKCMNEGCANEFETTYAPERPEKVFCEDCYQKSTR